MAKFIFQAGVFFGSPLFPGDTSTQITVYDAETGLPVETLWEDEDGTVELSNPFNIAEEGHFFFYADAGKYNILATMGVLSRPWNDVILGGSGGGGGALPPGGSAGQVLAKASNANYDTEWINQSGGGSDRRTVTAVNSSAGVVAFDYALGDYFTISMSENITSASVTTPPAPGVGGTIAIRISQDSTPRTFAFPAEWQFTASSPLTTIPTGSGDDAILILTTFDGGAVWWATMDTLA